jgi:prepilin signal peptidase PulO-like enzyme (type II secretory pathway)
VTATEIWETLYDAYHHDAYHQSTAESLVLETIGPNTLFLLLTGVFFIGASVGSFINVVVYRFPLMVMETEDAQFNLAWPPSNCPHCSARIRPWHNIPVLSYCWLKGRSACCRHRISPGYVIGEISAGLLAVTVILILNPTNSSDIFAAAWSAILVWWLMAIACLAWQHPSATGTLSQTLLWLGLLANLQEQFAPLHQAVLAVCCWYCLSWLAVRLTSLGQQNSGIQTMCAAHLAAAGFGWFGFSLVTASNCIIATVCAAAFAILRLTDRGTNFLAYPGPDESASIAWPTWLQGLLITIIVYQWLVWAQDA